MAVHPLFLTWQYNTPPTSLLITSCPVSMSVMSSSSPPLPAGWVSKSVTYIHQLLSYTLQLQAWVLLWRQPVYNELQTGCTKVFMLSLHRSPCDVSVGILYWQSVTIWIFLLKIEKRLERKRIQYRQDNWLLSVSKLCLCRQHLLEFAL